MWAHPSQKAPPLHSICCRTILIYSLAALDNYPVKNAVQGIAPLCYQSQHSCPDGRKAAIIKWKSLFRYTGLDRRDAELPTRVSYCIEASHLQMEIMTAKNSFFVCVCELILSNYGGSQFADWVQSHTLIGSLRFSLWQRLCWLGETLHCSS